MRHEERKNLAFEWILPLVDLLYWSLILSISLFIAGFLTQLRNLATSFNKNAPILQATWGLGIILASFIIGIICATTLHAVRYEDSPFEGGFSRMIVKFIQTEGKRWDLARKVRRRVNNLDMSKHLHTFWHLVVEAGDPRLLDRAVPSFSYSHFLMWGGDSFRAMRGAYDRFTATDTSLRVRETIRVQILRFATWCRDNRTTARILTWQYSFLPFLLGHCSFPEDLRAAVLLTSVVEGNDKLYDIGLLSEEGCIANILCTYNEIKALTFRAVLFHGALGHCESLLKEGRTDMLTRILSYADPCSILKSFITDPKGLAQDASFLVRFIVRGRETEIWQEMSEFLRGFGADISPENVFGFINDLLSEIDPNVHFPFNNDLSWLIARICRHEQFIDWFQVSDGVISYLNHCDISQLSDQAGIRRFLELSIEPCLDIDSEAGPVYRTQVSTRDRARDLLASECLSRRNLSQL